MSSGGPGCGRGLSGSARPVLPGWGLRFYDAYGDFEWLRLEARAYGRLQAIIHSDFLRKHEPGQRVLDAGCGPGRFTIELVELGVRPVALDTSPLQLKAATERRQAAGVNHQVEAFVRADIVDLSQFPDESFDLVVCFGDPLSYVRDKREQAAAELVRVARPGGMLLVSVMSRFGATCNVVRRATLEVLRSTPWPARSGRFSIRASCRVSFPHPRRDASANAAVFQW